jgi:hypothetical protein
MPTAPRRAGRFSNQRFVSMSLGGAMLSITISAVEAMLSSTYLAELAEKAV